MRISFNMLRKNNRELGFHVFHKGFEVQLYFWNLIISWSEK